MMDWRLKKRLRPSDAAKLQNYFEKGVEWLCFFCIDRSFHFIHNEYGKAIIQHRENALRMAANLRHEKNEPSFVEK